MDWSPADKLILALIPLKDYVNWWIEKPTWSRDTIYSIQIESDSNYHTAEFLFDKDGNPTF